MTPFRLAGLLRLRRLQQDDAAGDLARANAAARQAALLAIRRREALAGHRMPDESGALAWTAAAAARAALSTASIESAEHSALAAQEAGQATDVWHVARSRTKALEHLEERHHDAVVDALRATEQQRLDEHTTSVSNRPGGEHA